jgi:hypothetical protein
MPAYGPTETPPATGEEQAASDALAVLRDRLTAFAPHSVLMVGALPELDPQPALGGCAERWLNIAPADSRQLADSGYWELALVGDALEALPKRDGELLLAGLRDLHARRSVVRLGHCPRWRDHDLIAFGFHRLATTVSGVRYFGFDIATYKPTPDWLNADHWANPRLFDRFRW